MSRKNVNLKFKKLHPDFKLPKQATPGSAGLDLVACIEDPVTIMPGHRVLIPLGFAVEIPEGWEMQLRPRSGLAFKEGITILNTPGTIDSDYRDEVKAMIINHGSQWFKITPLDRICQAVISEVPVVTCELVDELTTTERAGGFGSTGR